MFNLALFMDIIKGHTCTLRAVDTDGLTEHLASKFSPAFIGDIQRRFTENELRLLIALFICTCFIITHLAGRL